MVEATGELATKVYNLVEAVKADGRLRKGANEATKSIERGEAKLVISAGDVNPPEVIMHLPMLCREKNIPFVQVPAKAELGAAAGLLVGTSAVAVALAGDAKNKLSAVLEDLEALSRKPAVKAEPKAEQPKEVKEIPEPAKEKTVEQEIKEAVKESEKAEAKPKTAQKPEPKAKKELKQESKAEKKPAKEADSE